MTDLEWGRSIRVGRVGLLSAVVSLLIALAPASGAGSAPAQALDIEIAAPATVVDDLSVGFTGKGRGWHSAPGGYADHHSWVPARRRLGRIGIWRVALAAPGRYRVLAKVPRLHATSRRAVYKVRTAAGWVVRVRDQARHRGRWMSLGTHELSSEAEVRLTDKTLDPRGTRRKLAFDALRFIPVESPDPPVITTLDVEPRHDRAIITIVLAVKGPARSEYRRAGTTDWLGAAETSSKWAERRQVFRGLEPETDYDLRVIATNMGGQTTSLIKRFTTLEPPPPVISDLRVTPEDTRTIVRFSLDAKGPARSEYREAGDSVWIVGARETSSKWADHRHVIKGLAPETDYELRVIASNDAGETVSPIKRFATLARSVACDAGQDLQAAIDRARKGDTVIIEGTCRGNYRIDTANLTLKGRPGAKLKGKGAGTLLAYDEFAPGKTLRIVGLTIEGGGTGVFCGSFKRCEFEDVTVVGNHVGVTTAQATGITVRDSVLHHNDVAISSSYQGGTWLYGSVVRANGKGISADNAVIEDSTIKDNGPHGGISARWLMLRRSEVLRNRSDRGGGILVDGYGFTSAATIEDSTIQGNSATTIGGGIWLKTTERESSSLTNVVMGGNIAGVDGGGLYATGKKPTLTNVTFTGNMPNACTGC